MTTRIRVACVLSVLAVCVACQRSAAPPAENKTPAASPPQVESNEHAQSRPGEFNPNICTPPGQPLPIENGTYYVISDATPRMCLDRDKDQSEWPKPLQTYFCNGSDYQKFNFS